MVNWPRGVEYDLVMSATVSMSNQHRWPRGGFATDAYAASAVSAIPPTRSARARRRRPPRRGRRRDRDRATARGSVGQRLGIVGSTIRPPPVFATISGNAPLRGCTTGTPMAMASSRNMPFGSVVDGRHRQNVEPLQNRIFPSGRPRRDTGIALVVPPRASCHARCVEIIVMLRRQDTRRPRDAPCRSVGRARIRTYASQSTCRPFSGAIRAKYPTVNVV